VHAGSLIYWWLPRLQQTESPHARDTSSITLARCARRHWACLAPSSALKMVQALLNGSKLSVTQLGRHREGFAHEKHHIAAADRLLATRHLHAELDGIYRALARTLLLGIRRPVIIVDWSDIEPRRRWLVLKAAVPSTDARYPFTSASTR
jgi:hypothetical protein